LKGIGDEYGTKLIFRLIVNMKMWA